MANANNGMNDGNSLFARCCIEGVTCVSLDLWDTLILRDGGSLDYLYEMTGEQAARENLLPDWLSAKEFASARRHVAMLLQKKLDDSPERVNASVADIYASMPRFLLHRERICQLELALDRRLCFLNPEILDLLSRLNQAGKKMLAACDSPHNTSFIKEVLAEKGVDIRLFDRVYSSSQLGVSKRSGMLYRVIMDDAGIPPNQLLHIGANLNEDVVVPRKLGINVIYYDNAKTQETTSLEAERMIKGDLCPEYASLRRISACKSRELNGEDAFWYRFGASVLGPVLAEFAEWVLDCAERYQTRTIHPLMREGALLEKLLKTAAKRRGFECTIEPLYVSRYVVMFAGKDRVDESLIRRLIVRRGVTLGRTFEIFGVTAQSLHFSDYYDLEYYQYKDIRTESGALYDQVIAHLTSPALASRILSYVRNAVAMCRAYLEQAYSAESLTVDIGYSGTIQRGIERILGVETEERRHLLLFASETPTLKANITEDPLAPGTLNLQGFFDTYGAHAKIVEEIYWRNRFLELLMMDERGSTVGYEQVGDRIEPVLKHMASMTEGQLRRIAVCQEGVLQFQEAFLNAGGIGGERGDSSRRAELLNIVHRVMCHPTTEEATFLGSMLFDENNGADWVSRICEEADVQLIRDHGIDALIRAKGRRNILWPEGLVANALPDYSANNSLRPASEADLMAWMLVRMVIADGVAGVVVCGAGQIGRHTALYLKCCGIDVEAFADNNPILHDISIDNIKVSSLTSKFNSARYVVSSFAHRNAIMQQIKSIKGPECSVYAL